MERNKWFVPPIRTYERSRASPKGVCNERDGEEAKSRMGDRWEKRLAFIIGKGITKEVIGNGER